MVPEAAEADSRRGSERGHRCIKGVTGEEIVADGYGGFRIRPSLTGTDVPLSGRRGRTETTERTQPQVTLAVLALGGVSYAILSSLVVPALPTMMRELHTDETGVTWLLTAYLLAASVGTAIIGRLGDMYGKERLLFWTLIILACGTLMSALANTLALQIVGRFVQGAAGGIFPLAFSIVRDEFPPEKVAGGIGLLSAILGIGGGIGIVLSGFVVEHLDYHWLFWFTFGASLAAAILTWKFVPESPVRIPGRVNWLAAGLMTIGISAVLVAVSETTNWGWGSAKTLGLAAIGFAIISLWILVETISETPLIDMTMMRIRGVWTTNAAAFLLGAGMYASLVIFPQFAQLPKSTGFGFGASVIVSGLYMFPSTFGMTLFGIYAGRICAPLRVSARDRNRARLCRPRQPDRAGGAARADRCRQRRQYGDENARRRPRRSAFRHLHRLEHRCGRTADRERLHPVLLDGDGLPGSLLRRGPTGPEGARPPHSARTRSCGNRRTSLSSGRKLPVDLSSRRGRSGRPRGRPAKTFLDIGLSQA